MTEHKASPEANGENSGAGNTVVENAWRRLNQHTDARIGLGRAGTSLPTAHHLKFQLDHARARDAVLRPVAWPAVIESIQAAINTACPNAAAPSEDTMARPQVLELHSRASDRSVYLQRPDLGRQLDDESRIRLQQWRLRREQPVDLVVVVGDGLSATAVEEQVAGLLKPLLKGVREHGWRCDLICCAAQCRVALGDEVAEALNARFLVVLIGERPGLSAADSLGVYYTYLAKPGCSDADRNCLSNVRPRGLGFEEASRRLIWLMSESAKRRTSGVQLKDDSSATATLATSSQRNFLIPDMNTSAVTRHDEADKPGRGD